MEYKQKILIIDDEPEMLSGCAQLISMLGHEPITFTEPKLAINYIKDFEPDLIFTDLLMNEFDGIQVLEVCQKLCPNTPVVVFSAYGTIDRAVTAMKAGAFDFIEKPFELNKLKIVLERGIKQRQLLIDHSRLLKQLEDRYHYDNIIGKSKLMQDVFELIESVAESDSNILITGESGTGKELIARSIHFHSRRKNKSFVPVNCGSLPENLFEAELFGYEKGAFTGAMNRKMGLLEYADGGTFFLDEVCELPLNLQTKLLRTLQDQKLRRIGGNELIQVDVRIISATNRNVQKLLSNGVLRKDFYYRLNVINIDIPPLRNRREDIALLANYFLKKFMENSSKKIQGFSDDVIHILENYSWPGNVRELENVVERAVTLTKNNFITQKDLPESLLRSESNNHTHLTTLNDIKQNAIQEIEKKYLISLLEKHQGNISKISSEAGLTRRHVYRLLSYYDLNPNQWRTNNDEE